MPFGGGFRRGGFNRFDQGPREMHKIKCSECGKDGEVPFRPREGAPVYCRDCFMKRKGIQPREQPATESTEAKEETSEEKTTEETTETEEAKEAPKKRGRKKKEESKEDESDEDEEESEDELD